MIADLTGWRGPRRAPLSSLVRARYRHAASALRMSREMELAGQIQILSSSVFRFTTGMVEYGLLIFQVIV